MSIPGGQSSSKVTGVLTVRYSDLLDKNANISEELMAAFGPSGLGIIAVSGVPSYSELRQKLLALAERLAALPEKAKRLLEDPASRYSFGWSHGKERLESGHPDVLKGSFYANPVVDKPTASEDLIQRYPSYCRSNLWPTKELPELEPAFKELGKLMIDVGLLLAYHCDKCVSLSDSKHLTQNLERMLRSSMCHKGRLLHYFAPSFSEQSESTSSWCGWHTDHGSLTGLTCGMYMRDGKEVICPDKEAGLYIKTQAGEILKAIFKEDEIAYQIGETSEVLSCGLFNATPHCVKAAQGNCALGLVRNTFAVFMQPHWDETLTIMQRNGVNVEFKSNHNMNFGEYSEAALSKYYGTLEK